MSNKIINLNLFHPEINGNIFIFFFMYLRLKWRNSLSGGVNEKLHNYFFFFNWGTLHSLDVWHDSPSFVIVINLAVTRSSHGPMSVSAWAFKSLCGKRTFIVKEFNQQVLWLFQIWSFNIQSHLAQTWCCTITFPSLKYCLTWLVIRVNTNDILF